MAQRSVDLHLRNNSPHLELLEEVAASRRSAPGGEVMYGHEMERLGKNDQALGSKPVVEKHTAYARVSIFGVSFDGVKTYSSWLYLLTSLITVS